MAEAPYKRRPREGDDVEVDVLADGMDVNSPHKGAFALNMLRRQRAWEVRSGLGQMFQGDTTMARPSTDNATAYGYDRIMGCYAMRTNFGHTQIVTLLRLVAFTGSEPDTGVWGTFWALRIYDATTNKTWEEVLFRHTSENNPSIRPMPDWRGAYESGFQEGFASWVAADPDNEPAVWFAEYQDALFFGSPTLGAWVYVPADFDGLRRMQIDSLRYREYDGSHAESSRVFRLVASDGQFSDAYAYLTQGTYPSPTDATVFANRFTVARGHEVLFADEGRPGSIIGINVVYVPSEDEISALSEVNGNLYIFTPTETWLYQPSPGTVVSSGKLVRVSDTVGCQGPRTKVRRDQKLVWCDRNGAWSSVGLYQIDKLSDPVAPLFQQALSNPLNNFFTASGVSSATAQPRLQWDWKDAADVHMAYWPLYDAVLFCVPAQNVVFVLQDGWHVWATESFDVAASVDLRLNLTNPRLLHADGEVYCVTGLETFTPTDAARAGGGALLDENAPSRSFAVLQLGRGGGLDRSVEASDDQRDFTGWYDRVSAMDDIDPGQVLLGPPVALPQGYTLFLGAVVPAGGALLYPLYVCPLQGYQPDHFDILFTFDNVNWRPITAPAGDTSRIDPVVPPERQSAVTLITDPFDVIAPTAGLSEVRVYNAGVPDQTGNEIRVRWDGASGGGTGFGAVANEFRGARNRLAPLIWLPFRRLAPAATHLMSLGVVPGTVQQRSFSIPAGPNAMPMRVWHQGSAPLHSADDVAQSVDWAYKTPQIGLDEGVVLMARTLYLRLVSHGRASSAGLYGLLNAVIGSDWKEWSSQMLDYDGTAPQEPDLSRQLKETLRNRFRDVNLALRGRLFANDSVIDQTRPAWGSTANGAAGNFLIDDEQLDEIAISDSVKGQWVQWMLFGMVRNRAERLVLDSARGVVKVVGGRRRAGRP